jgi:hypothetical protein
MFSLKLFLCCDSASVDLRTNTISAFHITEQLGAPTFPVAIPRIHSIALINREETDPGALQLQLDAYLGNQQIASGPFNVNFANQLSARGIAEMQGLVLPGPGALRFVLRNRETTMGSWTVSVVQLGQLPIQMLLPAQPPAGLGQT